MSHKSRKASRRSSDVDATVMDAANALTVSTSSGYSTSDEQTPPTAVVVPVQASRTAVAPTKSTTKRKTRAPTNANSPLLKRIKVDAVVVVVTNNEPTGQSGVQPSTACPQRPSANIVSTKPPLPPLAKSSKRNATAAATTSSKAKGKRSTMTTTTTTAAAATATVNKLNAYADQCRAEIAELKVALANEKTAVRALRAQNDADIRRLKSEHKQRTTAPASTLAAPARGRPTHQSDADGGSQPPPPPQLQQQPQHQQLLQPQPANVTLETQCQSELKKLRTENCILRDANKQLEDKNQIFCRADRQKTNDVRQVRDSYEQKLAQTSKSANVEIHRLLDEIKSKDKALETLRKEAIDLRSSSSRKIAEEHQHQHQHHLHPSTAQMRKENVGENNNTKPVSNTISYQKSTSINATHGDEAELLNAHDMHERISGTHINGYSSFCGTKDQPGSDNDSALSSAPPSLSPQPGIFSNSPDEWNLFAKDCKELRNLRKDFETTQEENQFLNFELAAAKEQIETLEKTIFVNTDGNKCDELYQRISYLERELEGAQKEAYELREQNELLEFRNIELEESFEKSKAQPITDNLPAESVAWRPVATCSNGQKTHAERMVATIQPYSTLSVDETDRKANKVHPTSTQSQMVDTNNNNNSSTNICSQCTQTDVHDFAAAAVAANSDSITTLADQTSAELCAEIQKLNRFRKKIEQCAAEPGTESPPSSAVAKLLATNTAEARRLQFYRDRLEQLENKVLVYESSGDAQTKRLADRLQREVQLDACVKRLTERCNKLVHTNRLLEEEKCEYEEAENDARHLLQKLEVELEMFRQRNAELEMMGEAARAHANCLEDTVANAHERIQVLEEHKTDLKEKLDMLTSFLPSILLCAEWKDTSAGGNNGASAMDTDAVDLPASVCQCIHSQVANYDCAQPGEFAELQRLMDREKALKQNIEHLNQVYSETLENADTVWAQLEADYKQQLAEAREETNLLRAKIYQLEDRLQSDSVHAAERIAQLEDAETQLQRQLAKSGREQKQHADQLFAVQAELDTLSDKYTGLKGYVNGPMASALEKERRKHDGVQEELRCAVAHQVELDEGHKAHIAQLRGQLNRTKKELLYINVSNGELKEEVDTLEHRLVELEARWRSDAETIKALSDELHRRHDEEEQCTSDGELVGALVAADRRTGGTGSAATLAQELQHATSFGRLNVQLDVGLVRCGDGTDEEHDELDDEEEQFGDTSDIGCYMSRTEL